MKSHGKGKEDGIVNTKSTHFHGITRLLNVTLILFYGQPKIF